MGLRNVTDVSMKIDTVAGCGWTTQPCIHKNEYCLAGTGGRLNCLFALDLDVAGARFGLGLNLGLEWV
jgi:hypothetical protein